MQTPQTINKLPPQSIESEEAVLSACLLGAAREVCGLLSPSDMYRTAHQKILTAINGLVRQGERVEIPILINKLREQSTLEECGGAAYIARLVDTVPSASSVESFCKIIKEKSIKRHLIAECSSLMDACYNDNHLADIIDQSKRVKVQDKSSLIDRQRMVDISNVYNAKDMLESYSRYIATLKNNRFLTGIGEIDKRIRGVAGGETLFIIARAGAYKTALLQNMLRNYVNASSWGSVFFSLEMPIPNITERYLQQFDSSPGRDIEALYSHKESDPIAELERRFRQQLSRFYAVPTKVNLSEMEQYVRLIESEYKTKIGVLGIDYMGLVSETGKEYEQISKIARGSKDLAKYLNIPVIVLSQINRKGESGQTEVTLDMGRGSGAIEEAADFMLGLWTDVEETDTVPPMKQVSLIAKILKNRKGPTNSKWRLDLTPEYFQIGGDAVEFKGKNKTDCKDGY